MHARSPCSADVIVENFRPGTMKTFGLDHPAAAAANPDVGYVSISGYGQDNPWSGRPALAPTVQADVSMMATMLSVNKRLHAEINDLDAHGEPLALGAPESPMFTLADGTLVTIASTPIWTGAFLRYCTMMGRNDLRSDPRFATPERRRQHATKPTCEITVGSTPVRLMKGPWRFDGEDSGPLAVAAGHGAHNETVLHELGLSTTDIEALVARRILWGSAPSPLEPSAS